MSKKVILILCEGQTDRVALAYSLTNKLTNHLIKFEVINGDFITKYENEIFPANVDVKVTEKIREIVSSKEHADYLKPKDYEYIIYMTDSDDCFIETSSTHINKRECLLKLFEKEKVKIRNIEIPFRTLIMSKDLEAVLYGEVSGHVNKVQKALQFNETCELVPDYLETCLRENNILMWDTYCDFIEGIKCTNNTASNINLLLDLKM